MAVHLFSDRLLYASPFVGAEAALPAALAKVQAGGGTALFDHLYLAVKQLESRQGRRVVDRAVRRPRRPQRAAHARGGLAGAAQPGDDLLAAAGRRRGAAGRFSSWKNAEDYRREWRLLGDIVAESGGRVLDLAAASTRPRARCAEILDELRDQYVLGYYPLGNRNDGGWHKVRVTGEPARRLRVRPRGGYLDY